MNEQVEFQIETQVQSHRLGDVITIEGVTGQVIEIIALTIPDNYLIRLRVLDEQSDDIDLYAALLLIPAIVTAVFAFILMVGQSIWYLASNGWNPHGK